MQNKTFAKHLSSRDWKLNVSKDITKNIKTKISEIPFKIYIY